MVTVCARVAESRNLTHADVGAGRRIGSLRYTSMIAVLAIGYLVFATADHSVSRANRNGGWDAIWVPASFTGVMEVLAAAWCPRDGEGDGISTSWIWRRRALS